MINFYNPYMTQGNYMQELQNMRDRIDNQIQQAQQQQQNMTQLPMQQPTNLTQNFQLAPNNIQDNFKLVNNLEDVQKEVVITDTYFISKDNTKMWIKSTRGDIRTFNLEEIIPKDDKDILIENLQKQLEELKGGKLNGKYDKSDDEQLFKQSDTRIDRQIGKSITEDESSNVSIVPDSKTTKRKP